MKPALLAVLLVACSSPTRSPAPGPVVAETPPRTQDPGAVQDTRSLQETTPPPPEGDHDHEHDGDEPRPDGASCLEPTECASGICEGEGCGPSKPGRCAPKTRGCTKDLRPYCSCEGETFRTSGSCPGRRYYARAECTRR
jgi:hypothetical protein